MYRNVSADGRTYDLDPVLDDRGQMCRDYGLVALAEEGGYCESLERAKTRLFWVAILVIP